MREREKLSNKIETNKEEPFRFPYCPPHSTITHTLTHIKHIKIYQQIYKKQIYKAIVIV